MGENQVQQGLYSQSFEHDNCGIGAVVNIKGRKDHQIVADALKIVEQLEHRAGKTRRENRRRRRNSDSDFPSLFFQSMSGNRHRTRRRKRIRNRHVLFPAERVKAQPGEEDV